MDSEINNRLNRWITAFPRVAGATAVAVGSIVTVGWMLDIQLLKSILPSLVSMKANMATVFVLAGVALLLHSSSSTGKLRVVSRFLSSIVVLIGLVTVAEYAFSWDAGIDQLLFTEPEGTIGTFLPGRMAFSSAISSCLIGVSLLMLKRRNRWSEGLAQVLALFAGVLGMLALIAYMYGLNGSSGFAVYTRMAVHTSITFVFLSIGIICLQHDIGVMAVLRGEGSGGFMARRLMPAALGIPLVLGWLVAKGEMSGLYGPQYGNVLDSTLFIALFVLLLWITGRSLNTLDAERKELERSLLRSEKEFKELFDDAPVGYHELDTAGRFARINQTELGVLGYRAEEMLGRFCWEFVRDQEESRRATLAKLSGAQLPARGAERIFVRKDGTTMTALIEDQLLRDAPGRITGIRTTLHDITELKKAQELLRETEERDQFVLQNLAEGVAIVDEKEMFMLVNPAAETIFGVPAGSLIGRCMKEFVEQGEFERIREQTARRQQGETASYDLQISRPDGTKRDILVTASPITDEAGLLTGALGIFRDVTERKKMDEALRQAEAHYRLTVENATDLIYNIDLQGCVTSANAATSRVLGYSQVEIVGRRYLDFVTPEFRRRAQRQFMAQWLEKTPSLYYEAPVRTKEGRELWLGQNVALVYENEAPAGFLSVSRDITERKLAEEALGKSEEKFRNLFDNAQVGMFRTRLDGSEILEFNKEYLSIVGYTREEVEGKPSRNMWADTGERDKMAELLKAGDQVTDFECGILNKQGEVKRCITSLRLYRDTGILEGSIQDITERKRAEEALRQAELRYRLVVENANEAIFVAQDGVLKFVNRGTREMSGYSEQELTSMPFRDFIHPADRDMVVESHLRRIKGDLSRPRYQFRLNTRDGYAKWVEVSAALIDWEGKPATLNFLSDISERKRLEQERDKVVAELRAALENVRTLGGLVPICASCKKIRDDKGYWNQLEKYLGEHTDAKLTHGLCPDCAKLYFPDAAAKAGL